VRNFHLSIKLLVHILYISLILNDLIVKLAFPVLELSSSLVDSPIDVLRQSLQLLLELSHLVGLEPTQLVMPLIITGFQLLLQIGLRLPQRDALFLLRNQELILSPHLQLHGAHQILEVGHLAEMFFVLFLKILEFLWAVILASWFHWALLDAVGSQSL
jgi:hypothetical protein